MYYFRPYHRVIGTFALIFTNLFLAPFDASSQAPAQIVSEVSSQPAQAISQTSSQRAQASSQASNSGNGDRPAYASVEEALRSGALWRGEAGPSNLIWIDGGQRFSYAVTNPESRRTEIRAYTPSTGDDQLLFDGAGLTFPESGEPFTYRSFQWAGDSDHMLFETNFRPIYRHSGISDFYFYTRSTQTLKQVARDAGTAELSPDGGRIGFERGGNLYIYEFATDQTIALTNDATEHVFNGRTGWVYEEEFMITQAWQWSPDGRYIAFWQEDESEVPIVQMTNYEGQHPEFFTLRYPKVGDTNPTVRIGVVDVVTGDRIWLDTGKPDDSYIPRIYWTADEGVLALVHLSRNQRELNLFFFDAVTGDRRLVMQETSEHWIDIFNFFEGIEEFFFFPQETREFYWLSDRDGFRHLYRYAYDGELLNQVTRGEWEVTYIHALDARAGVLYYSSTEVSPLERHLYRVNTDGTDPQQITTQAGRHLADVSPDGQYVMHSWSAIDAPREVHLRRTNGDILRTYVDGSTVRSNMERRAYFPAELHQFTTSDGELLDVMLIKPAGFDESLSYPVVLDIYGGPGAQSVYNQFETSMWRQYLASQGFIVASVNNRGSGGRGRDFEKIVYRNLGYYEAFDFNETGNWLASLPYADSTRMAIRGHSYGGYMVLYTMTSWPDRFQRGISAAPVTDWMLYDTIYTERYMDELHANAEGYRVSSPTQRAGNLKGELLLVHSSMDENVHVQHTFQFARALIDHRIDAHLRIFPPGAHGVSYSWDSYIYLMQLYTDFLMKE